jgi:uncharacterized protein (DUF3820 family)
MAKLTFGKYQGYELEDVPEEYIQWVIDRNKTQLEDYERELDRRARVGQSTETMIHKIVTEGFRALSKKYHPDAGGSDKLMHELGASKDFLMDLLKKAGVGK